MKKQNNKYFFESEYVEVFPCAYRGTYTKDGSTKIYNPEVRLNTERTATRQTGGIAGTKSYIINLTENALECVVGGYYFNIKATGWQKTVAEDEEFKKYGCKAIVSIVSKAYGPENEQHYTTILAPLVDGETVDGTVDDMTIEGVGYFVALAIVSATYNTGNDEYELKLLDSTGDKDNSSIFITDKIISANGNGSIASADSSADGDHSFSFGSKITSSGDQSYIFGNSVIANGNNVLIVGNDHNGESYEDLVILGGSKVAATRNGQVIIGQVTDYDKDINIKDLLKINKDNEHFESSGLDITEKVLTFGDFKINNKDNEKEITIFSGKCSFTEKETVIKNKLDLNSNIISTDGSTTIKGKLTAENSLEVKKAEESDKNAFTVTGGSELDTLTVTGVSKLKGEITISGKEDSGETTIDGGIITGKTATFDKITMSDQGVISVPSLNINGRNTASEIITCVLNTPTPGEGDQPALKVKSALTVDGTTNLNNTNLTGDISVQLSAKDDKFEIIDKDKKSLFSVKVVDLDKSAEIKIDHLNINGVELKGESGLEGKSGKLIVGGTISSNGVNVTDTVEATTLKATSLCINDLVDMSEGKITFKKPITFTSATKAISTFNQDGDDWKTINSMDDFFNAFNVDFSKDHEYVITGLITLCAMASEDDRKIWGECVYPVNFVYKSGVMFSETPYGKRDVYTKANKYESYVKNWYWTTIDVTKPTGWLVDNRPFLLIGPENAKETQVNISRAWSGRWGKGDYEWPHYDSNTEINTVHVCMRALTRNKGAGCWAGDSGWSPTDFFDMSKTKLIITSITDYGEHGLATQTDAEKLNDKLIDATWK